MKVCVIGGGASGMMCATMIARKGHQVTLFEQNEKLGKKIYITGKGRCNVTNVAVGDEFLKNVKRLKNVYMKLFLVLFLIIRTFNGIVAVNHK